MKFGPGPAVKLKRWHTLPAIGFAVILGYVVVRIFAAGPAASFLPPDGTISGNASVKTQAGAIGGRMLVFGVTPTPTPTATPTPTPTPTPAPGCGGAANHVPGGPDGTGTCWPGAGNTGVPAGTVLSAYTGPCTITTPSTVINAKTISCDLTIQAAGVTISNSQINGTVSNEGSDAAFTVTDSTINATPGATRQVTGIQSSNYTATRVNVTGGNRGMYCSSNCTILDSYVHGQKIQDNWHASAIRFEQDTHVTHNTIVCDAPVQPDPEGSCSASLTGYPDFAIIHDVYINHNLFPPTQYAAFCAYGGSTNGKTYSGQSYNVSFTNNIFTKGPTPDNQYCALYGPISDFDQTRPGMVWQNNKWNDGEVITP